MIDDGSDGAVLDITSSSSAVVATSISANGSRNNVLRTRAADDACFLAVAIEQREQACNFVITETGGIAQMRHARHR
jgi:hypothetical protein